MRKEERHQIKRDDLATVLESASDYVLTHRRSVGIAAGALVAIALAFLAGRSWWNARQAQASRQLGELIATYNAPITASIEDLQKAKAGAPTFTSTEERDRKVIDLAQGMLKSGASGSAQAGALLYRGMAQADLQQDEDAAGSLQEVIDHHSGGLFGSMARLRLARLREGQGQFEKALALYQWIADDANGPLPREEGLVGMARCDVGLGKKDEAVKIYQRLVDEYPGSEYVSEARTRIADLS